MGTPLALDNVNRRIRGVTKGPWRWRDDGTLRGADGNAIFYPDSRNPFTIRELVNRDADAELIVTAVNEYLERQGG